MIHCRLNREQTPEECPVAAQREPEILGPYAFFAIPLPFKLVPLLSEHFRQALRGLRNQTVRLLDRIAGFIDETCLNSIPAKAMLFRFVEREQCRRLFIRSRGCNGWSGYPAALVHHRLDAGPRHSLHICFHLISVPSGPGRMHNEALSAPAGVSPTAAT